MPARPDRGVDAAQARRVWRQTIWRLRKLRRWSQDRLALELQAQGDRGGYRLSGRREHVKRTIQHWEAAETLPGDDYAAVLVLVFARLEELKAGRLTPGSELARLMGAFAAIGYDADRRGFLLSAAALAATGRDSFAADAMLAGGSW